MSDAIIRKAERAYAAGRIDVGRLRDVLLRYDPDRLTLGAHGPERVGGSIGYVVSAVTVTGTTITLTNGWEEDDKYRAWQEHRAKCQQAFRDKPKRLGGPGR